MSIKRRNFTFALTKDNERIISIVKEFPLYAYIKHDKDEGRETHYHYYIEFPNPRSIDSVASDLGIPSNMIEKVLSKKNILQYLTHENQSDKYHYDKSEVITNLPESAFFSNDSLDLSEELGDFVKVRNGFMTPQDFVKKYNLYCATLSFYSRISLYAKLCDSSMPARGLVRAGGRSSTLEVVEQK